MFVEKGKLENPKKNPLNKRRTNNNLDPHMTLGQNQTQATLVGGNHSNHCANHCVSLDNIEFHATVVIMTNLGIKEK